jgi:hypothetical protein
LPTGDVQLVGIQHDAEATHAGLAGIGENRQLSAQVRVQHQSNPNARFDPYRARLKSACPPLSNETTLNQAKALKSASIYSM